MSSQGDASTTMPMSGPATAHVDTVARSSPSTPSPRHVDGPDAFVATETIPADPTFDKGPTALLQCIPLVWRIGEMFGDFSYRLTNPNAQVSYSKWQLRVTPENRSAAIFDEELPVKQSTKVVKLKPSTGYYVATRVFSELHNSWGPWSEPIRTMTMTSVVTSINEIGEDYARILWDRPTRDATNVAAEVDRESTQAIADILQFELRVVREADMLQEFCDEFPTGVRTYTLHELRPATAYIVFVRYMTLIGTKKQWGEVCRFYTQASHEARLKRRGEDTFTVEWARAPLAENTVGYLLPDSTIHKFQISVDGEGADSSAIELASSTREYTVAKLCPGTEYAFRVRCLTKEGRWGARGKPLAVRTADRPRVVAASIGETFMSLSWTRTRNETIETLVECDIRTVSNSTHRVIKSEVGPEDKDKVLHIDGLIAGTTYLVSLRTFLDGEWGLWTEPRPIRTAAKATLVFKERGEDFLTLDWVTTITALNEEERRATCNEQRYLIVVHRVDQHGDKLPILEQEARRSENTDGVRIDSLLPDTAYEVQCASWQRNPLTGWEGWGELSSPLCAQTLQSVALQIVDLGEDFAQLSWRRSLSDRSAPSTVQSHQWLDLKYEIIVGCVDTGEDRLVHKEVLDTTYTISNLLPDTNYIVSVRACDEREQWGLWCRAALRTLAAVVTSTHEIGEDFIRVMWERQERKVLGSEGGQIVAPASSIGEASSQVVPQYAAPAASEHYISQYSVFVFSNDFKQSEVPHREAGYHRGGDSEVAVFEQISSLHSSCRIGNLIPDREYVVVVRALTSSGKWGLWSRPLKFRTVSQFRIPVNSLSIGENYVHIVWNRDESPPADTEVQMGDFSVVSQQLRIHGVETPYSKDHSLNADIRELKLYGLSPTTAYCIQLRACSKSGEWGLWSAPVYILTRATITTRPVEVAEDYLVISWERKKAANPKNYPTGKGLVTSYHLRVSNAASGICTETFLGDGDCPYRITGLKPDTYYCVELKANYNDEEWGLWSTPLWCLTMRHLEVKAQLISEEFCNVKIVRPQQHRRLPEDDGNRATEDRVIAFGQLRSHCMLCVTTPSSVPVPHSGASGAHHSRSRQNSVATLPQDCHDHRLVYQVELVSEQEELLHTIPNLKANTIYHASVRSKLDASEWGMWSIPSLRFATVPTIAVGFAAIGENYVTVDWKRGTQTQHAKVQCGLGIISKSRLKLRDITGTVATRTFDIDSSANQLYIDGLQPAATYAVSVQTFNDNYAWGMWSEEAKVRTVPSMQISVEHITEDAVWVSWDRMADIDKPITHDTVLNVDTVVRNYEVKINGEGYFCFSRELEGNKLFFRGLQPDTVYEFKVRALNKNDGHWGLWSSQLFRTQPTMRVTFGNIGEHFAVVEWRRHLPQSVSWDPDAHLVEAQDLVQEFRLKVEKVGEEAVVYELSPNISSFRLTDLQPSAEYRVWMCAKGYEGVWGLWNQEARVRTLPQLELTVQDIGEDYISVNWSRLKWEGERAPDAPGVKVWEIDGAVSGYHIKVLDVDGNIFSQQHCGYTTTKATIGHLSLKSVYSVQVCAKDTYDEWGLWSDARRFVTLQPVKMNLLRIGEDHVSIEWGRRGKLQRRFVTAVSDDDEDLNNADDIQEADDGPTPASGEVDVNETSGGSVDAIPPNIIDDDVLSDTDDVESLDEDIIHGNETVKQWHLRVYGRRVYGGQPGAEDYVEFYTESATTFYNITNLLPKATYSITVRAQNMAGEWGHWCHAETVVTVPLLVVNLEYIAETFMTLSWSRPAHEHSHLVCFPPPTGIHNYQVQIKPLPSETPFDEADEPLVGGSRVYETSQPSLRLSNLQPGTRYRVVVLDEMINPLEPNLRPLVPDFGVPCEPAIVETVEPMSVDPTSIGENYCTLAWGRMRRPIDHDASDATAIIQSKAKVVSYEIQAYRLDDNADQIYKGSMALELCKSFPASTQQYQLTNLVPNGIYAIAARAQLEGGFWGHWSTPSKFVTQKRLTVHMELINEDSLVVSWARDLPDWATSAAPMGRTIFTPDIEGASSCGGDDEDVAMDDGTNTDIATPPPPANPLLEQVIIGDYNVNLFEIVVEGVNVAFQQHLVLPNGLMSTRISGLASNHIYTVCVRSMSDKEIWSLYSPKVAACTLKGMELCIDHFYENVVALSWARQQQSVSEHVKYLTKLRDQTLREAEQHERKELFDMEQLRQAQEAVGDGVSEAEADSAAVERSRALEHYMAAAQEMAFCLSPQNVHYGKYDTTGYQLQLFGAGGTPFIPGTAHLLQQASSRKRGAKGGKKKGSGSISGAAGSGGLVADRSTLGASTLRSNASGRSQSVMSNSSRGNFSGNKSTSSVALPNDSTVLSFEPTAPSGEEKADDSLLLDTKINTKTNSLTVLGLQDATEYEFSIRARNLHHEWGQWSERKAVTTLQRLTLNHTRFGEHYINLFWHRLPQQVVDEQHEQQLKLKQFAAEFKDLTPKDLERMRESMTAEEYQAFVARLREWKTTQRLVAAHASGLAEGLGMVESAPNTAVKGYHLRVIQENGTIRDTYFPDAKPDSGHQFTVTGLQPNTMYIAMLCADYGLGEWGSWSEPTRFMTQNLIQLQLTYVGESFIDIEWRRAPNKKLPKVDEGMVLTNPTTQGRGHQYEVSITWRDPDTQEEHDDRRPMNDCSVFRIDNLRNDTKYQLALREWDAKGEWGLWSSVRTCCTLAGMDATVHEIGESWAQLSWARRPRRKLTADGEGQPQIVQLPVEAVAYYLRVEELVDNGYEDPSIASEREATIAPSEEHGDSDGADHDDDILAMLQDHHGGASTAQSTTAGDNADGSDSHGTLPVPEPPRECEPCSNGSTRYCLIRKFNFDVNEIKIEDLRPDTFYNVQVLCETTGGQLGTWSADLVMLSLSKLKLRTDLIDEQSVRLSWTREAPRSHPRLQHPVVTGHFQTATFDLEAFGHEKKNSGYKFETQFTRSTQEHKLADLVLNSCYGVRVRATDTQERFSLWSDDLYFVTLKPLRVLAGKLLEHHVAVEWGRDHQSTSEYPPTSTPIHFGQERANQYHLRVYTPQERNTPLLDRQFAGTTTKFHLGNLSPNSCYIVQARSCNLIGEWGLWSEDRVVYTMKLVEMDVQAVGEDYIKVCWRREEPDELQDMIQMDRASLDDVDDDALVDENAFKTLLMRKRYPLLDRPSTGVHHSVYASARTVITKYTLSITKRGETEDIVMDVPATYAGGGKGVNSWTISHLRPDTQYSIAIRAFYGDDDWGLWSERVVSGTMNLLAVDVKYIGEDYMSASWQRSPTTYPASKELTLGKPEDTLCYEFMIHDFSEVPIGEEASADLEQLFVRGVLVAKLKVATVKGLRSNRRYRMCVRRWYHPIEANALVPVMEDDDKPMTEEQRLRALMDLNHGTPGSWSDVVYAITLKDMVALVDEIAEDSLLIRWDRDPNAAVLPTRHCLKVPTVTQSYHVRIDAMTSDGTSIDNGQGTLHLDHVFGPDDLTYRVPDLQPDAVYKVDVRCCSDKVWGQWSKTLYLVTLPKLRINVVSIGEDYINVTWERRIRSLTLPDGSQAVVGNNNNVEKYHMDMTGVDHHFRLEKKFKASRTSYRVKHLEAQTVYHISVRSCDVHGSWSLWSDAVVFVTLNPLRLVLGKAGEQFVHVSWERPPQTQAEFAHIDPNMQLGRTTVASYHLCVFAMDQAPATAVVDKQFHGDINKYRITTLSPNTSYIIIVRACNDEAQWGLWSEERVVRTQRVLSLQISGIGENYVAARWEREEADAPVGDIANDSTLGMPVSFHLAITSESETVDRHFTIEDCTPGTDDLKLPQYVTRGLSPDTKYLMALQPCYGNDEWGLWTKPITFVTLNRISIMTTGVSETKVDLAWGRAQQSVELATDPNIVTWRGTIVKYQLLLRKLEEMHALARREKERAAQVVSDLDTDPTVEGHGGAPSAVNSDNSTALVALEGQVTDASVQGAGDSVVAVSTHAEGVVAEAPDAKRRQSLVQEPDELRIEREIDVKQVKYVQTSCSIDSLQLNTDYHVQVRALDNANEWGCWTELIFDTPPPPPSGVSVRKSGAQYCIVTWEAPELVNRYQYVVEQAVVKESTTKRGKVDMTEWKVVDTAEETQSRIRAFGPLNKIRFRVKCCKLDRPTHIFSQYSEAVGLSATPPPEPVGSVTVVTLSRNSATIEWTKPMLSSSEAAAVAAGEQLKQTNFAYRVLISVRDQPPALVATTKNLTYTLNDLDPNTAYKLQVQVESDGGISQKNVVVRFTTKADSDRTVSRAQAGQPPLGTIVSRPETSDGVHGQETVRLPAIATSTATEPQGAKGRGKSPPSRSKSAGKPAPGSALLPPKPPQDNHAGAAKRPQPGAQRTSPQKAAASGQRVASNSPPAARGAPTLSPPPTKPAAPRAKDQPLPPVRSRQGAPQGPNKGPVEQYDFVGFQHSDDEAS